MNQIDQMIYFIDGIFEFLITSFCCMVWTKPFLNRREKAWLAGGAYAITMAILNAIPLYINAMLAYLIGALALFLMMCLTDREYIAQKVFLAVTFFCLRWQAPRIVIYIGSEIDWIVTRSFATAGETFWIYWAILYMLLFHGFRFLLLYGAVKCTLWAYGQKREHMDSRELLLLSIPSVANIVFYGVIRYYNYIYNRDSGKDLYDLHGSFNLIMLLFTLFCFAIILVMTYVFRQWKTQQEEDRQREIFSTQMADLQSHISEAERLYQDLRSLRHDMGNHLMTLESLYAEGAYAEAGQYAENLRKEMQDISGDIASGNPVTDVILSNRKKEMEEKGIAFVCDFHYPMTESVNSFDVSIILNNALSNAIESIGREFPDSDKTAHISLTSKREKNIYLIEITNSYTGALDKDRETDLPRSVKSGEGHGLGLLSIRHAARKYLGDIEIGKEIYEGEERCVLRVMLQITEDAASQES